MPNNTKHHTHDKDPSHTAGDQNKSQSQDNKNEKQTRGRDFNEWLQSSVPKTDQEIFGKAFDESERLDRIEKRIADIKGKTTATFTEQVEKDKHIELLNKERDTIKNWLDNGIGSSSTHDDYLLKHLRCQTEAPPEEPLSDTPDASEKIDSDNYFLWSGDFWRIRFKGGKDISIQALDGIWYIAQYISHRGEQVDRSHLYNIIKSAPSGVAKVHGDEELSTSGSLGFQERCKDRLTPSQQAGIEDGFQSLYEKAAIYKDQGKMPDAEKIEDNIEEYRKEIEKKYQVQIDPATNKVKSIGNRGAGRDYSKENVRSAMNIAIKHIKKAGRKDLVDHLQNYLLKNIDIYLPPSDFPDWHVET